jgi:hypothetical protein
MYNNNIMNKHNITLLVLFISSVSIIFNFNLTEIYSQRYDNMDDNVIPLLIPPYKIIKGPLNYSSFHTINK